MTNEVDSSSDDRTVNNTFRTKYRVLSHDEKKLMDDIRGAAEELLHYIEEVSTPDSGREKAIAKTKLEESVMWAIKGLTK